MVGWIIVALFGAVILGAGIFSLMGGATLKSTAPTTIPGSTYTSNPVPASVVSLYTATEPQSNPGCPVPQVAQQFLGQTYYPDYSKAHTVSSTGAESGVQLTAVASQTMSALAQYPQPASVATSSASSGSTYVAITNLQPCITYLVYSGDNSGYMDNGTWANPGQSNNVQVPIIITKYSAPIIQESNTSASPISTPAIVHSITLNTAKTYTFYLVLEAGQYTSCEYGCALSFAVNNLAISSIVPGGLAQASLNVPSMTFITSNTNNPSYTNMGNENAQWNYQLPPLYDSLYWAGGGSLSVGQVFVPVQVTTTSTIGTNEIIGAAITPSTAFFNQSSRQLQYPVFKNPQTGATLFSMTTTANALILADR